MRSVSLDLGVRETAFCEVHKGLVLARRTVAGLASLEDVLGPSSRRARVDRGMPRRLACARRVEGLGLRGGARGYDAHEADRDPRPKHLPEGAAVRYISNQ
jgi:hypothetical protein